MVVIVRANDIQLHHVNKKYFAYIFLPTSPRINFQRNLDQYSNINSSEGISTL